MKGYNLLVLTDAICHLLSRYKVFLLDSIIYCNPFLHNILIYDLHIKIGISKLPYENTYVRVYFCSSITACISMIRQLNGDIIINIPPKKRYA